MDSKWAAFLSNQGVLSEDYRVMKDGKAGVNFLAPLTHLTVLKVSGRDAAKLLQGQLTCNVNEIGESSSRYAAMCNPKGRVIATFLVIKNTDDFLLILPGDMAETVLTRLKMYVLRSDVRIENAGDGFCILGICEEGPAQAAYMTQHSELDVMIALPGPMSRSVRVTAPGNAVALWTDLIGSKEFRRTNVAEWRYCDILCGFPWVGPAISEAFIPQSLNLDKLGAISFSKGCYTGQEIVARTHYLGKSKRVLRLADCVIEETPQPNTEVIGLDREERLLVGTVLQAERDPEHPAHHKLLLVLHEAETASDNNLGLNDDSQTRLNLLP